MAALHRFIMARIMYSNFTRHQVDPSVKNLEHEKNQFCSMAQVKIVNFRPNSMSATYCVRFWHPCGHITVIIGRTNRSQLARTQLNRWPSNLHNIQISEMKRFI